MVYKTICSSGEVGKLSVIVTDIKQYGMIVKHWQGLQTKLITINQKFGQG